MMATARQVLAIATGELGYNRYDDPAEGTKYGRWYAQTHGSYFGASGVPFCAMGVSWTLSRAGMTPPGGHFAYVPAGIAAARREGRLVDIHDAAPGDLVCFDWDDDGEADHIGIVELNRGSYVQTIEFNTSGSWAGSQSDGGGVYRRTRGWGSICAMIRPAYDHASAVLDALVVDGIWGPQTTRALQEINRTPADGVISDQWSGSSREMPACSADSWEWVDDPAEGSTLVRALQTAFGVTVDGIWGPETTRGMQAYYGVTIDAILGPDTVSAMQKAVNKQKGRRK
ncbi:CHAP domain-containing protein [Schaalia sp. 19OD2882]|uniref:CHAP domain-containing protein n=1 Tax=Schaalia sp. 19OD2882 TaxID=2794089 RepID=UPI001C1F0394|nr:CHAP domain-containing protein [Schaalia sp. 19OD2882]QWW20121.1 CHAP domain-containing protein [Schaalia sp. 19OD2882]